jgi:hypothetical protein
MCLLSKTFTTFAKSKKNGGKKTLALTSKQKYLIAPLISVGQHENVSYAQRFVWKGQRASVNSGA